MPSQEDALKKMGPHEVVKRHDDGDLTVKGANGCLYVITIEGEAFQEVGCAGRARRGRSAYREFVSQCMKSKHIKGFGEAPQAMRDCAAKWRARKAL